MLVKTQAIVISALKYQEKSLIVKCFTKDFGLKTYFVPNAFSGKKNNQKIAFFQPLTFLEIEANHKGNTLNYFKEIKIAHPFQSIPFVISKSSIAIFLAEILNYSIKEEEENQSLFSFLETAFVWLDTHNETPNFHLVFLLELTKYLGFYPAKTQQDYPFFELTEGIFSSIETPSCLNEFETILIKKALGLKFDSTQKMFTNIERQILLKNILEYYNIHLEGFKKPKSLDVLKEVFE